MNFTTTVSTPSQKQYACQAVESTVERGEPNDTKIKQNQLQTTLSEVCEMLTKEQWIHKMIATGARESSTISCLDKVTEVVSKPYLEKYECVEGIWIIPSSIKGDEFNAIEKSYSKTRNLFARKMRKDNWTVACKSYWNIFNQYIIKLEAERPRSNTIQHQVLQPVQDIATTG